MGDKQNRYSFRKTSLGLVSKAILTLATFTVIGGVSTQVNSVSANEVTPAVEEKAPVTVETLDAQIVTEEAKLTEITQAIKDNNAESSVVYQEIKALETEISASTVDVDKQISAIDEKLAPLTETVESLQEEAAQLEAQKAEIQQEIQNTYNNATTESKVVELIVSDTYAKEEKDNKGTVETVLYSGEKVETIELTKKQQEAYKETGNFEYVPNMENIANELNAMIKELRELNGIDVPVPEVGELATHYAQLRADEMAENDVTSHATKYNDVKNMESIIGGKFRKQYSQSWSKYSVYSDKEYAYRMLQGWYSEYNNMTPGQYGHRYMVLFGTGQEMGVAIQQSASDLDYISLNFTDYTSEDLKEFVGHLQKIKVTDNKLYYNGQRQVFLPKMTFKYTYTEEVQKIDEVALNELRKQLSTINSNISVVKGKINSTTRQITRLENQKAPLVEYKEYVTKTSIEKLEANKIKLAELSAQNTELRQQQIAQGNKVNTLKQTRSKLVAENAKKAQVRSVTVVSPSTTTSTNTAVKMTYQADPNLTYGATRREVQPNGDIIVYKGTKRTFAPQVSAVFAAVNGVRTKVAELVINYHYTVNERGNLVKTVKDVTPRISSQYSLKTFTYSVSNTGRLTYTISLNRNK